MYRGQSASTVTNYAGGVVHRASNDALLERYLSLGVAGTYYVSSQRVAQETIDGLSRISKQQRVEHLRKITDYSVNGKASSDDNIMIALAAFYPRNDAAKEYRDAYKDAFFACIRTGTHMLLWAQYHRQLNVSFGRFARKLVSDWYATQSAYNLLKYKSRYTWTHFDVWALTHPKLGDQAKSFSNWLRTKETGDVRILEIYNQVLAANSEEEVARLVEDHQLTHEFVPKRWHNSRRVWEVMYHNLPLTALLRNLNKLSVLGIDPTDRLARITTNYIKQSKAHPLVIFNALKIYSSGRGGLGKLRWSPLQSVVDQLERIMDETFTVFPRTNKRIMINLDVSRSMSSPAKQGSPVSSLEVCTVIALAFAKSAPNAQFFAFSDTFTPFPVLPTDTIRSITERANYMNFGNTNCDIPILYALERKIPFDAFMVMTDSETWIRTNKSDLVRLGIVGENYRYNNNADIFGALLAAYRRRVVADAKNVVYATSSSEFTLNDPNDMLGLDVCGFTPEVGNIITNFIG